MNSILLVKTIYLIVFLALFPTTLLLLHQVLFEEFTMLMKVLVSFLLPSIITLFYVFQFIVANISHKIHKTTKTLITTSVESQWMAVSVALQNQINGLF